MLVGLQPNDGMGCTSRVEPDRRWVRHHRPRHVFPDVANSRTIDMPRTDRFHPRRARFDGDHQGWRRAPYYRQRSWNTTPTSIPKGRGSVVDQYPTYRSAVAVPNRPDGPTPLALADLSNVQKLLFEGPRVRAPGSASVVDVGFAARIDAAIVFSVSPEEWFVVAGERVSASGVAALPAGRDRSDARSRPVPSHRTRGGAGSREGVCSRLRRSFHADGAAARTSVAKTIAEVVRMDIGKTPSYLISCGRSFWFLPI